MGCPSVRGDNPRALASGLSYVQVDKHGITILYHPHQEIFYAKVGKGGIMSVIHISGLVNTWNKRIFLSSCDSFHDMRQ